MSDLNLFTAYTWAQALADRAWFFLVHQSQSMFLIKS